MHQLVRVLALGGTVFAFNQHTVQLKQAKQEIKSELANLHSIQSQLTKLENKEPKQPPSK